MAFAAKITTRTQNGEWGTWFLGITASNTLLYCKLPKASWLVKSNNN